MPLSNFVAPVAGLIVTTSTAIAVDGLAKQLLPSDMKPLTAFALKLGTAVVGGLFANKIATIAEANIQSVITTALGPVESEDVTSAEPLEEN